MKLDITHNNDNTIIIFRSQKIAKHLPFDKSVANICFQVFCFYAFVV